MYKTLVENGLLKTPGAETGRRNALDDRASGHRRFRRQCSGTPRVSDRNRREYMVLSCRIREGRREPSAADPVLSVRYSDADDVLAAVRF